VPTSVACVRFVCGSVVGAKRTVDRERSERDGDGGCGRRGTSESGVGKREDGVGERVKRGRGRRGRMIKGTRCRLC
jgi:hypothetical protein